MLRSRLLERARALEHLQLKLTLSGSFEQLKRALAEYTARVRHVRTALHEKVTGAADAL